MKVRERVRGGEGEGKGQEKERDAEVGRLKGQGRGREGKGNYFNFCSFGSFRNGFEIPKQTERGDYTYSFGKNTETEPKLSVFRFEPKEKKSVSQDTLVKTSRILC